MEARIVPQAGNPSASHTRPCDKIVVIFKPLKLENGQRCAHPRRTSVTPNPRHTTAVIRNVGIYSDPSHAMHAERACSSGFTQIPQIPKAMQTRPNTKQIDCSITTIAFG